MHGRNVGAPDVDRHATDETVVVHDLDGNDRYVAAHDPAADLERGGFDEAAAGRVFQVPAPEMLISCVGWRNVQTLDERH